MQDSNSSSATASGQNAAFQAQVPSQSDHASPQTFAPQVRPTLQTSPASGIRQGASNAEVPWVNIVEPMYKSIFRHLRSEIERGRYKAGDKLPSVRTMVADFAVSHPTVLRALEELASLGYVKLVQGSGSYVNSRDFSPQPCSFTGEQPAILSAPFDAQGKQNGSLSGLASEPGEFSTTEQNKNKTRPPPYLGQTQARATRSYQSMPGSAVCEWHCKTQQQVESNRPKPAGRKA